MRRKSLLKSAQQEAPLPVLDRPPHPQQRALGSCPTVVPHFPFSRTRECLGKQEWFLEQGREVIQKGPMLAFFFFVFFKHFSMCYLLTLTHFEIHI